MSQDVPVRELAELLHVSHVLGCNPRLNQAGGGNTSVKHADGKSMYIKASGTPLSRMTPEKGWVLVDMEQIRTLFARPEIYELDPNDREKEVLKVLYLSVIKPDDARPSVETPLHMMLDRVVMHSHPVAGNAVSCHPDGKKILGELFPDTPTLWVPYVDPGATLAFEVVKMIEEYKNARGDAPRIILLQNHGLFVSADTPTDCFLLQQDVLARMERYFIDQGVEGVDEPTRKIVSDVLAKVMADEEYVLRFSQRPELIRAAKTDLYRAYDGPLSPDHVVYAGPKALIIEDPIDADAFENGLRDFRERFGIYPRIILIRGQGICIVAATENKVDAAEEMALSAEGIASLGKGNFRFLPDRDADFILNWEAEHYRAKIQN